VFAVAAIWLMRLLKNYISHIGGNLGRQLGGSSPSNNQVGRIFFYPPIFREKKSFQIDTAKEIEKERQWIIKRACLCVFGRVAFVYCLPVCVQHKSKVSNEFWRNFQKRSAMIKYATVQLCHAVY